MLNPPPLACSPCAGVDENCKKLVLSCPHGLIWPRDCARILQQWKTSLACHGLDGRGSQPFALKTISRRTVCCPRWPPQSGHRCDRKLALWLLFLLLLSPLAGSPSLVPNGSAPSFFVASTFSFPSPLATAGVTILSTALATTAQPVPWQGFWGREGFRWRTRLHGSAGKQGHESGRTSWSLTWTSCPTTVSTTAGWRSSQTDFRRHRHNACVRPQT